MDNIDVRQICLDLLEADTEVAVIDLLTQAGLWSDERYWRPLGGDVNNYSTAGNQQSRAEQAIIEKLLNSIDTKLMAACRSQSMDPKSPDAPRSMKEARETLFGEALKDPETLSRSICVSATGNRPRHGRPSFTIVDDGEGQSPESMHDTILSLHAGNKKQIPFVQGKFNMGGTGVLEFCGAERNVQFILSRRNPSIIEKGDDRASKWNFTIVRRDDPESEGGTSKFVYLAPIGAETSPNGGDLLSFETDNLPIFPEQNRAYGRRAKWGTAFKLYEYEAKRFATHILRDGLLDRMRLLIPEPALPIRFHECREGYRGHEGSFDTTMVGLIRTLLDDYDSDKRNNVEWHDQFEFRVRGQHFTARLFLFKDKKTADGYRKDEGIVFSYNGQSHATLTKDFFRRKRVKQDYLWHSLLMVVDCSDIGARAHEELFMASRDGLRDKELKRDLEAYIEDELANHEELRQLANERRRRELSNKPAASDSMANLIGGLLAKNPDLAKLLGMGTRIQNPHRPVSTGGGEASYEGERFPTFFRFRGREAGQELVRDAHLKAHCRVAFETDAENDYFKREDEPGRFDLFIRIGLDWEMADNFQRPRLYNGYAHLTLALPENANVGNILEFKASLTDPSRVEPIDNYFRLNVKPEATKPTNSSGARRSKTDSQKPGAGGEGDDPERQQPSYLDIPTPRPIERSEWENQDPPFDKYTALRIKRKPNAPDNKDEYDYLVNVDNIYLQNFLVGRLSKAETIKLRFQVALVLIGLSLCHQRSIMDSGQTAEDFPDAGTNIADMVQQTTSAIAPFLLPMIESVSQMETTEEELSESAGEEA